MTDLVLLNLKVENTARIILQSDLFQSLKNQNPNVPFVFLLEVQTYCSIY